MLYINDESRFRIDAEQEMVVSFESISAQRKLIEGITAEHGGECDGWEAAAAD